MRDSLSTTHIKKLQHNLLHWYRKVKRNLPWRNTTDPYAIWVSEVMLQQTQVSTVIPYYLRFFKTFPTIHKLACANMDQLLKHWEGLGYYSRARNLHKAANIIVTTFDGIIPKNPDIFKTLPGVGPYINAAVMSIAYNIPLAVVDGNVKRVLSRLLLEAYPVNQSKSHAVYQEHADRLLHKKQAASFNQAMMELGALTCKPTNPDCPICPVQKYCLAYQTDKIDTYPKKEKKKKVPTYHIAIGVIFKKNTVLITKRPLNGFLGGLWEFPGGKIKKNETPLKACKREIVEETNIQTNNYKHLTKVTHAYSHFKVIIDVYTCNYVSGRIKRKASTAHKWIMLKNVNDYAFPGANHKFIPHLLASSRH